jgi:hypothetical protein
MRHKTQTIHYINDKLLSSSSLSAAYCVYERHTIPFPSRPCLFIYRPRIHAGGPSISTSQCILGSWDSSCDILFSFYIGWFLPIPDVSFLDFLLVLISYPFPAPACVLARFFGCLGYLLLLQFFSHSPISIPSCSRLPAAVLSFPFCQQLFFSGDAKVYQYIGPHITELSRRIDIPPPLFANVL